MWAQSGNTKIINFCHRYLLYQAIESLEFLNLSDLKSVTGKSVFFALCTFMKSELINMAVLLITVNYAKYHERVRQQIERLMKSIVKRATCPLFTPPIFYRFISAHGWPN